MGRPVQVNERNKEIVTFFYMVFGHRVHCGMDPDEARKEAYDAVALRYGITKGTLFNIISAIRNSRMVNEAAFRENVRSLIADLGACNEELSARSNEMIARNEKLISLLQECLDHGRE
jgi:hypothetical protein